MLDDQLLLWPQGVTPREQDRSPPLSQPQQVGCDISSMTLGIAGLGLCA